MAGLDQQHAGFARILLRTLRRVPGERYPDMLSVATEIATLEQAAVVTAKQSYRSSCMGKQDFYREFYVRFFRRCPEARAMFSGIDQQYAKLDQAMHVVLNFSFHNVEEPTPLTSVAAAHAPRNVTADQLDHFAASLIDTLRDFSHEPETTLAAWEHVLRPSVAYLKRRL
jgi:hemoglobin-like flavoprotein